MVVVLCHDQNNMRIVLLSRLPQNSTILSDVFIKRKKVVLSIGQVMCYIITN